MWYVHIEISTPQMANATTIADLALDGWMDGWMDG
jgi:hypothetical protein